MGRLQSPHISLQNHIFARMVEGELRAVVGAFEYLVACLPTRHHFL